MSWFGDFSIILDMNSPFRLTASFSREKKSKPSYSNNENDTNICLYSLRAESFRALLDEHEDFKKMATFRALDRRAYFL